VGPPDPQRPAWRWPLGLLVLGLGLWGLLTDRGGQPAPQRVSLPALAEPIAPPALPARAGVARTERPREASTSIDTAAPLVAADQLEICGFGTVPLVADDPYSLRHIPLAVRQRALDEVELQLLGSADPQVQAAALLIGARTRGGSRSRIDQLVRLAVVSQDPLVYAIALEACKGGAEGDAANCALLSLAQWVRLEPDNAQPWLELAAQAQRLHDADAEADAMRHAAQAHRSDAHLGALPNLVVGALGEQTPQLQRTLVVAESWNVQAAWGPPHTGQAKWFCGVDVDADPSRRETCEAIAGTLSYRGTSVKDLGVGLAIGTRLGWPAPQLQALQQEYDAVNEAGGAPFIGADLSCEVVDRMQDWMRQLGTRGELQLMRDVVARSGRSIRDWSGQYRKNIALAAATAQAASMSVAGEATP